MRLKMAQDRNLEHFSSGTPHNTAQKGDIAPTVLMPGDPLRAQYIAETRLENARKVTGVRNMFGFTGAFGGKDVTIMGSGMGGPSMGIYSFELFAFYGVERIIRIGTCGGMTADIDVGDLVIAMTASSDSNYAHQYDLNGTFSPCARLFSPRKSRFPPPGKGKSATGWEAFFHPTSFLSTARFRKRKAGRDGQIWDARQPTWSATPFTATPPISRKRP